MTNDTKHRGLYPAIKPYKEEYLDVSDVYACDCTAADCPCSETLALGASTAISYTLHSTEMPKASQSCSCMAGECNTATRLGYKVETGLMFLCSTDREAVPTKQSMQYGLYCLLRSR